MPSLVAGTRFERFLLAKNETNSSVMLRRTLLIKDRVLNKSSLANPFSDLKPFQLSDYAFLIQLTISSQFISNLRRLSFWWTRFVIKGELNEASSSSLLDVEHVKLKARRNVHYRVLIMLRVYRKALVLSWCDALYILVWIHNDGIERSIPYVLSCFAQLAAKRCQAIFTVSFFALASQIGFI